MACWEEPHWRSSVVAGTDSGQPAASTALRPMLSDCSPTCMTQPVMTSSTRDGSRSLRAWRAFKGSAARSTACQLRNLPLRLPPAVRTASTITAVVMVISSTPAADGLPVSVRPSYRRPPTALPAGDRGGEGGGGGRPAHR